jgi:hypothetical protein
MNKDVIYIEPEDDITDIITKIENSKEKIVALVPPKKAGVFRSIVNIKLIAKVGFTADKTIVLVTTDPSITKLAGATKIPVTKNLQTPPSIPNPISGDEEVENTSKEELVEEKDGEVKSEEVEEENTKEDAEKDDKKSDEKDEENGKDTDEEDDKKSKKGAGKEKLEKAKEKGKKAASDAKKFSLAWFKAHKAITIGSLVGVILIVVFFVWAFVIAPAVTITVGIRTTSSNFSKSAIFTKKLEEENVDEGKFYLTEKKLEKEANVNFEATGQKNVGEKAKGNVAIYAYFSAPGTVGVSAGDKFTIGELSYVADADATISWDGAQGSCENSDVISGGKINCKITSHVNVTAANPGEKYNIAASSANWKTSANVSVYSDSAMAGGTDQMVTVVSQADVDKAKEGLTISGEKENKEALMETLAETDFPIESSFKQSVSDVVSTPAVGEEVKEGVVPKITVKVTNTIYLIDKTKVEEYITKEAKLSENYKIYQMNDPFVENFIESGEGYTGKIKTSYVSGPKVTENDIIEIVKGKGIGDAQHDLASIDGINGSSIRIDKSYPWVMSVPGDTNKITVILDVKDKE